MVDNLCSGIYCLRIQDGLKVCQVLACELDVLDNQIPGAETGVIEVLHDLLGLLVLAFVGEDLTGEPDLEIGVSVNIQSLAKSDNNSGA